jgi:hypothetical protein
VLGFLGVLDLRRRKDKLSCVLEKKI